MEESSIQEYARMTMNELEGKLETMRDQHKALLRKNRGVSLWSAEDTKLYDYIHTHIGYIYNELDRKKSKLNHHWFLGCMCPMCDEDRIEAQKELENAYKEFRADSSNATVITENLSTNT